MSSDSKKNNSVLIINDNVQLVSELSKRCERLGLDVSTARDVREAAGVFDDALPSLLMFNVDLAADNDRTFINCLEAHEDTRDIPVILLCDPTELQSTPASIDLVAYRVEKCIENWWRIEMYISELIDLESTIHCDE